MFEEDNKVQDKHIENKPKSPGVFVNLFRLPLVDAIVGEYRNIEIDILRIFSISGILGYDHVRMLPQFCHLANVNQELAQLNRVRYAI